MTKPKIDFSIGDDLYGVSIDELDERISVLKEEISRLEGELTKKKQERAAADNIFGPKS